MSHDPGYGSESDPLTLNDAMDWAKIKPGHIVYIRCKTYSGDFICNVQGTQANPVIFKPYPPDVAGGLRFIIDGSLTINGDGTQWHDLEIYKSGWDRETSDPGSDPADITDSGLIIKGAYTQLHRCIIHDVASVGFWSSAIDAGIYDSLIYYIGWIGPDRGHGHAMYSQNVTGIKSINSCVAHSCFGNGPIIYGSSLSTLVGYEIEQNTSFMNGNLGSGSTRGFLIGGESGATLGNILFNKNLTYGGSIGAAIGYNSGGDDITITNNYLSDGIQKNNLTNLTESGNTYNTIGDAVYAFLSEITPNRGNITIFNQSLADSVNVDVSSILSIGDNYKLRNTQDYFNDTLIGTVGGSGIIAIDMRAISHTVATPVNWDAPDTTFPEFGCFIIEKV